MQARKRIPLIAAISTVVGALGLFLHFFSYLPLLRLETFTQDLRAVHGRKAVVASDLVLLTIDDASLHLDGLFDDEIQSIPEFSQMRAGWPWSRVVHAAILDKLIQAGARTVAFDLVFPSPGKGDSEFSEALQRHAGQVVIGATFDGTDSSRPGFSRPSATLLDPAAGNENIGFANFVPDPDGVVRAALFHATPEDFADRPRLKGQPVFNSLSASILHKTMPGLRLSSGENVPFRFSGPPGTYVHHPIYEIFIPRFWQEKFHNGAFFKNKIVVIGPEGGWSHDEHPTPFVATLGTRGLMSGPEIHLQALAAARAGDFLRLPGRWFTGIIILLAAALGALINSLPGTPTRRFFAFCVLVSAWWFASQFAYNNQGFLMPLAAPILVLALTVFGGILFEFSRERFERLRSRATLERYVSSHVASEILDSPRSYLTSLVGVRKEVTVLFADLRNFTAMVNFLDAQELVTQLNEFYARIIDDIFQHSGTLDKIMGDGLMAVWGNLRSDGPRMDAVNAVRAGLAIQRSLADLNADWAAEGRPQLALGIGIAQGECVVGNIGSDRKMDLTVIGEAANLAARLQALTRENEETMLFEGRVAELVSEEFTVSTLSTVIIRGLATPVTLYSVGLDEGIVVPGICALETLQREPAAASG